MDSGSNMKAASETSEGFITMVKWGTIAAVLVAALVVILIA